ncbi:MAG: LacI family DNA-binding transcriptional regulator [Anaerolineae bacterium]|nr:LacI family DNA-binding transcriptional regulator [Anaerolineae bacterium]
MRSHISIKDIARAAGVSHSTVSRALKGTGRISPATRDRIRHIAKEMGYTPSLVARSLVTKRTHSLGLVVTQLSDPFIDRIVDGIEDLATAAGYSVLLSSSHADPAREMAIVEAFHTRRVDGVIVLASRVGNLYSERLQELSVPIVLINNQANGEYIYSVSADDEGGARLAVRHLLDLGHRRIGYIGSSFRPPSNQRRLAGYQAELKRAGITPDPDLIIVSDTSDDVANGRDALSQLLSVGATAVLCYNDRTAIGVLVAARESGISIPKRLSVVGFDDIDAGWYVTPPLTTIHQPRMEMGRRAMQMVLNLLAGHEVSNEILPCHLITRESTTFP